MADGVFCSKHCQQQLPRCITCITLVHSNVVGRPQSVHVQKIILCILSFLPSRCLAVAMPFFSFFAAQTDRQTDSHTLFTNMQQHSNVQDCRRMQIQQSVHGETVRICQLTMWTNSYQCTNIYYEMEHTVWLQQTAQHVQHTSAFVRSWMNCCHGKITLPL